MFQQAETLSQDSTLLVPMRWHQVPSYAVMMACVCVCRGVRIAEEDGIHCTRLLFQKNFTDLRFISIGVLLLRLELGVVNTKERSIDEE